MTATKQIKLLSIRMPEAEFRRIKSLAASRGLSLQEAVHQALDAWAAQAPKTTEESFRALRGSLAHVDIETFKREDKERELAKDRQRWS